MDQFLNLAESNPAIYKARMERETTSFLYRKDLNTIEKVNMRNIEILRR